ncbi:uncharacterized protein [Nothobranchius furzeri]|uniref:uncharacterized protein n=1 Tax=Nothobranchius furzeri TaxID=105023 RepID=UPI00077CF0D5|nr:uncharacterized protein LOC107373954 [Nothobranchius furzeri]
MESVCPVYVQSMASSLHFRIRKRVLAPPTFRGIGFVGPLSQHALRACPGPRFTTMADGAGEQYSFKWTSEQTSTLIKLRGQNEELFAGAKNSATVAWRMILEKMGLQEKVTPLQAKEKWDNLKSKYKDCKYPGSGEGVSGKPTAETWPWFVLMDEVLGQRPSTRPPVVIASIPEDTPGPSAAVSETEESESGGNQPESSSRRKRKRDDELLDLIREDMRHQREAEERRERMMERFLALMERLIEK